MLIFKISAAIFVFRTSDRKQNSVYSCESSPSHKRAELIVQELCESRGGCPGLSVLTSRLVSVDVKIY